MNVLKKCADIIYILVFSCILFVAFRNIITSSTLCGILFLPVLGVFLYGLFRNYKFSNKIKTCYVWIVLQILSTIAMIFIAFALEVDYSWDWGKLILEAGSYVLNGEYISTEYFARYPNNSFWVVFLIGLFKTTQFIYPGAGQQDFKAVSIIFSCILVQLTILFLYKTAKLIWNERKAFVLGCFTILYVPLYLYAMFAYTDTVGMLLVSVFVYTYAKQKKSDSKKKICAVTLGILAAFILQIKVMVFIICIAMLLDIVFSRADWKKSFVNLLIMAVVLLLSVNVLQRCTDAVLPISTEMSDSFKFPTTHWIMMGLTETGGYNQEDVDYTMSFPTYQEKKDATISRMKVRLNDLGIEGVTNHIIRNKLLRTWGYGCLGGDDYCDRSPMNHTGIISQLFTLSGRNNWMIQLYMGIYHIILIIGILLSGILAFFDKKPSMISFMVRLSMLGAAVFLMLWECNSRYLVVFIPVLMMVSFDGWITLRKLVRKKS